VTLTATWLLPIAIIPGTWKVFDVPETPQVSRGEVPSQPEPNEMDNVVPAETRKEGEAVEENVSDETENIPEPKGSTSQEPDEDQAWGLQSSAHTSKHQPPIPALRSCGPLLKTGTLIRCIPAPALSTIPSRISHPERILPQCRVTRHRCMDIISLRTLNRAPIRMKRQRTNPLRHRRLQSPRSRYLCNTPLPWRR
jgi:hypothetical protein